VDHPGVPGKEVVATVEAAVFAGIMGESRSGAHLDLLAGLSSEALSAYP
jgi:hypothetical protein